VASVVDVAGVVGAAGVVGVVGAADAGDYTTAALMWATSTVTRRAALPCCWCAVLCAPVPANDNGDAGRVEAAR
jgi:hypothetical protein